MSQKEEITQIIPFLKSGGVFIYPTDTVWGIGCRASDTEAIKRLFNLKNRPLEKKMILLVDSIDRLNHYVGHVPVKAGNLIQYYEKPLTIIYKKAKNLPDILIAEDGSIAIRIVKDEFCQQLIQELGEPLVSTSANFSNAPAPASFSDIDPKFLKLVDYVVKYRQEDSVMQIPSTIAKFSQKNELIILRK